MADRITICFVKKDVLRKVQLVKHHDTMLGKAIAMGWYQRNKNADEKQVHNFEIVCKCFFMQEINTPECVCWENCSGNIDARDLAA